MTEKMQQRLLDLKAAQESGAYTLCPRCGQNTMHPELHTNALSRVADIEVCPYCGMDEAKLAYMKVKDTPYTWDYFRPKGLSDFKALPWRDALERIEAEQLDTLKELYLAFLNGEDPDEITLTAFESCLGIEYLRPEPFQAKYRTADGVLLIGFRGNADDLQTCTNLIP